MNTKIVFKAFLAVGLLGAPVSLFHITDANDNCDLVSNDDQLDNDLDNQGDACDTDDDNDTVLDDTDNCAFADNLDQANADDDALGNACDEDDDNDGFTDEEEADFGTSPLDANDLPVATGGAGCSTGGADAGLGSLLLLLSALYLLRRRSAQTKLATLALLLMSPLASAQEGGFNAITLQPSVPGRGGLVTEGSEIIKPLDVSAFLLFDYSFAPVEISNQQGARLKGVIDQQSFAHLRAAMGLYGPVELSLTLPVSVTRVFGDASGDLAASSVGDASIGLKLQLVSPKKGFGLAALAELVAPSGTPEDLTGDGAAGGALRVLTQYQTGALQLTANIGLRLHPNTEAFFGAQQSNQVTYALAASYAMSDTLFASIEGFGAVAVGDGQNPAEAAVSVRKKLGGLSLLAGSGVGLSSAVGVPDARVFGGVSYELKIARDQDSDGIADNKDGCVQIPEDRDGFQDDDGCPDDDNDGDGLFDAADRCPNEAEDKDGFEDQDGCKDTDNDNDGLADAVDTCANQAEDKDGFKDDDGCPEDDNDGDGIVDTGDGCPNEAEVRNGFLDEDGCADVKPEYDFTNQSKVVFYDILFEAGSDALLLASLPVLDAIVRSLKEQPNVKVRIEGHTDADGDDKDNLLLSQKRALAVMNYLTREGISPARLDYAGYGETKQLSDNKTTEGKAKNRRVEFLVVR